MKITLFDRDNKRDNRFERERNRNLFAKLYSFFKIQIVIQKGCGKYHWRIQLSCLKDIFTRKYDIFKLTFVNNI